MASGRYNRAPGSSSSNLERIAAMDRTGGLAPCDPRDQPDALTAAEQLEPRAGPPAAPAAPCTAYRSSSRTTSTPADRMTTTAGSLALEGSVPPHDSHVAERLRAAGAILLAKANMSEWANIPLHRSTSGWSARGGSAGTRTCSTGIPAARAPAPRRPCSANFGAVAIGTRPTGRSSAPSSANWRGGDQATVGLVSRAGIISDLAHARTRRARSAARWRTRPRCSARLAGGDPRDKATAAAAGHLKADYTKFLDRAGLRGARIGVARAKFFGYSDVTDRLAEAALGVLRGEGAILVDPADIPHAGQYDDPELDVLLFELKADLNAYLATLGPTAPVRTLADVIAFNEREREREMPYFAQELFVRAEAKGPSPRRRIERRWPPAAGSRAGRDRCGHGEAPAGRDRGAHRESGVAHRPGQWRPLHRLQLHAAAVAGYPSVSVPMGYAWGLPSTSRSSAGRGASRR